MARWVVARCPSDDATADDYEAALAPLYAWMHALTQRSEHGAVTARRRRVGARLGRAGGGAARRAPAARAALGAGYAAAVAALNALGLGPLEPRPLRPGAAPRRPARHARGAARASTSTRRTCSGATRTAPARGRATTRGVDHARPARASLNTGSWVYQPHFLAGEPERARPTGRAPRSASSDERAAASSSACSATAGTTELSADSPGVKQVAWQVDAGADLELELAARVARRARSAGTRPGPSTAIARPLTRTSPAPSSTAHTPPAS